MAETLPHQRDLLAEFAGRTKSGKTPKRHLPGGPGSVEPARI
jgi:hypothetical protein